MFDYKILKDSFFIIIFALLIGFVFNVINPKGFLLISKSDLKSDKIVEISTSEAMIKFKNNSAIFIDARDSGDYKYSHVKDAINISVDDENLKYIDKKFSYPQLNKLKEFVIYCGGATCGLSKELASKFIQLGYDDHIYILKNGFPDWEEKNYPIEKIN